MKVALLLIASLLCACAERFQGADGHTYEVRKTCVQSHLETQIMMTADAQGMTWSHPIVITVCDGYLTDTILIK
jgi:hypothetical protein